MLASPIEKIQAVTRYKQIVVRWIFSKMRGKKQVFESKKIGKKVD